MDRHRDLLLAAEALGEADVVAVPVGQDQGADVGDRPAHRSQLPRDVPVVAGHAGVDDRHLAGLLEQVGVDDAAVTNAVDALRDLHLDPLELIWSSAILPRWLPSQAHPGRLWAPHHDLLVQPFASLAPHPATRVGSPWLRNPDFSKNERVWAFSTSVSRWQPGEPASRSCRSRRAIKAAANPVPRAGSRSVCRCVGQRGSRKSQWLAPCPAGCRTALARGIRRSRDEPAASACGSLPAGAGRCWDAWRPCPCSRPGSCEEDGSPGFLSLPCAALSTRNRPRTAPHLRDPRAVS
jgi:hypothetical protein